MARKLTAEQLENRIVRILNILGKVDVCRYCGLQIWWTTTKSGEKFPVSCDFLPHFADCPNYPKRGKRNAKRERTD